MFLGPREQLSPTTAAPWASSLQHASIAGISSTVRSGKYTVIVIAAGSPGKRNRTSSPATATTTLYYFNYNMEHDTVVLVQLAAAVVDVVVKLTKVVSVATTTTRTTTVEHVVWQKYMTCISCQNKHTLENKHTFPPWTTLIKF